MEHLAEVINGARAVATYINLPILPGNSSFPKGFPPICRCAVSRRGRECSSGGLHIPLPVSL